MERYGYLDNQRAGYPIAAWVWGHRLRVGQHWMEYMLEFLNVLAGFGYELGQGVNTSGQSSRLEYTRFTRLGLRRFVFYDDWEKTQHPYDNRANELLHSALEKQCLVIQASDSQQSPLNLARSLLRAFSAVEEQRSWFAKSLFPAHENLLFWEALRKGATKYKSRRVPEGTPVHWLDAEIVFDARNFFARGGELYYLILSAGTELALDRRAFITNHLQTLLTERNEALGLLANIIEQVWQQQVGTQQATQVHTGHLGWLPDPQCALYVTIAEDVATFLQADLDPLETLDLLAHLMGFHLTLYIYHRAHPEATAERHHGGQCCAGCRTILPVDALAGGDGGVIRRVSSAAFSEQEVRIAQRAQDYARHQVETWLANAPSDPNQARVMLDSETRAHFDLGRLSRASREAFEHRVDAMLTRLGNSADRAALSEGYAAELIEVLMQDFRKNFLGVHRKLAKAVSLVAPHKGPGARFVLGDNLLKAITLANLPPGDTMTYDKFLIRLYERYGFVVGLREARESGLLERHRINGEYFERNRTKLLEKMQHAGLAVEYSDATAVVG